MTKLPPAATASFDVVAEQSLPPETQMAVARCIESWKPVHAHYKLRVRKGKQVKTMPDVPTASSGGMTPRELRPPFDDPPDPAPPDPPPAPAETIRERGRRLPQLRKAERSRTGLLRAVRRVPRVGADVDDAGRSRRRGCGRRRRRRARATRPRTPRARPRAAAGMGDPPPPSEGEDGPGLRGASGAPGRRRGARRGRGQRRGRRARRWPTRVPAPAAARGGRRRPAPGAGRGRRRRSARRRPPAPRPRQPHTGPAPLRARR